MSVLSELFSGGRMRGLQGRSLENPAVSLTTDEAWEYLTDPGRCSSAGVHVSTQTALTLSAFWRGVSLVANAVAKTPLPLFQRIDAEARQRDRGHPAYRILHRRPNRYMSIVDFKQTLHAHVMSAGNGYAYIFRNKGGDPTELFILDPQQTWPVRENGKLWYVTFVTEFGAEDGLSSRQSPVASRQSPVDPLDTGKWQLGPGHPVMYKLRAEDVLHIKGLGYDGLVGYDVITYACESLGLGLGLRKYGAIYFKNGAHLGVMLEVPGQLSEEAYKRLKADWSSAREGLENAHKTVLLEEGTKANVLGVDARKAQLIQMRQFETREIANFCGVPSYMLGDDESQAFASLEQRSQDFLDHGVDIWFCKWEAECALKLLTEDQIERDSHYFEFVREALVRVDYRTMREGLSIEVNNGLANLDEGRAILNRPPLPDGAGQLHRMPANHELVGVEAEEGAGVGGQGSARNGTRSVPATERRQRRLARNELRRAFGRVTARIAHQAQRAARQPETFVAFAEGLQAAQVRAETRTLLKLAGLRAGKTIERYIQRVREGLLEAAECRASELPGRVEKWARENVRK